MSEENNAKQMHCNICNSTWPMPYNPDNPFIGMAWENLEAGDDIEYGKCEACGTTVIRRKRNEESDKTDT